jgi:hypothetical protein
MLLNLLCVAITLAGWVLFVVLVIKFRDGGTPHPAYRSMPNSLGPAFSENAADFTILHNVKNGVTMSDSPTPTVTIRVSGRLFESHLPYLNQLVQSATDCRLWAVLDLATLAEADSAAVRFLARGEDREFSIASCPTFVRESMERQRACDAA